jgi:hypothetical protein
MGRRLDPHPDWSTFTVAWANPPWELITKLLYKARRDKARIILIAPHWESAPWWPLLLRTATQPMVLLTGSLYTNYTGKAMPAPRWKSVCALLN